MEKGLTPMEKTKIEELAAKVLADASYSDGAVDIIKIAQKKGFVIGNAVLKDNEDGFIIVDDKAKQVLGIDTSRLIGVNTKCELEDKRFIIAHELGHFLLHYNDKKDTMFAHRENIKGKNAEENDADYFAACVLMPEQQFKKTYKDIASQEDAAEKLAKAFKVPYDSARRRILEVSENDG